VQTIEGKFLSSPVNCGRIERKQAGGRLKTREKLRGKLKKFARTVGEVIYGMTVYDMVRDLKKERSHLEHLFVLVIFGDLLGVPVLPPYYAMRLIPYVVPSLDTWKRSMLREKDITDLADQEIG